MLNTVPVTSALRQPRGTVKINSNFSVLWSSFVVENNSYYAADTFRVTLPLSGQPSGVDAAWWSSRTELTVQIYAGFPDDLHRYAESDLMFLIHGLVDHVELNPVAREVVLTGRDLASRFIDTKTVEKWPNQTASQIATALAQAHGLTPVVTQTTARAGRYYLNNDQSVLARSITEWDLLTFLAQQEGFDVYVKGSELHFEPPPSDGDDPYVLQWQQPAVDDVPVFNGMDLKLTRNLTLAKDVKVIVTSTSLWQAKPLRKTATARKSKSKGGTPQTYSFNIPNLTADQAQKRANELALQISRHELRFDARLPADALLNTRTPLELRGTNSAFDQRYYPDQIIRQFDANGYVMDVHAKNHSPESTVTV